MNCSRTIHEQFMIISLGLVHVPAKFRGKYSNAFLSYSAKTKRDGRTDGRTDRQTDGRTDGRGALQYLPSQASGAAGDNKQAPRSHSHREVLA